ncbi:hypothetical protein J6590_033192 [Homalodisca vitripennis]|nr:hypothetical protein J6590_033192 [Homalodisca vitripennis]
MCVSDTTRFICASQARLSLSRKEPGYDRPYTVVYGTIWPTGDRRQPDTRIILSPIILTEALTTALGRTIGRYSVS